jgi:hypothetical protein
LCTAVEQKAPLTEDEKSYLEGLLREVLAGDTSNDTQKMLNYVKKREIDTLRDCHTSIAFFMYFWSAVVYCKR